MKLRITATESAQRPEVTNTLFELEICLVDAAFVLNYCYCQKSNDNNHNIYWQKNLTIFKHF